jgi:hypothetical protein
LPPPDQLDDVRITEKLWEVIHALFLLRVFLGSTNHLSDRELYSELWNDSLHESAVLFPDNTDYSYHIDLCGSGSEEDNFTYMKYYADNERRARWARDWPDDVMPQHEDPPYDRDRLLPQGFPGDEMLTD